MLLALVKPKATLSQIASEGGWPRLAAMIQAKDVCATGRLHVPPDGPQKVTGAVRGVAERLGPTHPVSGPPPTQPEAHR